MNKMKKFYKLRDDYDKLHIIIQKQGYGRSYYEKNKYKREIVNETINNIKREVSNYTIDWDTKDKITVERILYIIERVRWKM